MPDTIDRIDIMSELLINNAELVTSQMKKVVEQLRQILVPDNSDEEICDGD